MPRLLILFPLISLIIYSGCQTGQVSVEDRIARENQEFLEPDPDAKETFRVLMSSDSYVVAQMKYTSSIERSRDKGGDEYMSEELKKFDIINEVKESLIKIWLYPDLPGRIMKIRPHNPTYLLEIDKLITEDIQRWTFNFPKNYVFPTTMFIRYRVVLQKDEDKVILKRVKRLMKESQ